MASWPLFAGVVSVVFEDEAEGLTVYIAFCQLIIESQ